MSRLAILLVAYLTLLVQATSLVLCFTEEDLSSWDEYKRQFNKTYGPEEERRRMEVFLDNKRYIENQNLKATPNSFEQGVNHLSDLTTEEINLSRCGFRLRDSSEPDYFDNSPVLEAILKALNVTEWIADDDDDGKPELNVRNLSNKNSRAWFESLLTHPSLDYREYGVVSRVKDQGACGSCWAFATTGALEALLAQRGRQILLSEQHLVDCSRRYGNNGCSGGLMNAALRYVRDRGIMSSRNYPYTGQDDQCKYKPSQVVTRCRGSMILPRGNEALLRVALALTGPIPVAIDAGARSFHSYKSGVYDDRVCRNSARSLNHAVLLVGYGTSPTGGDYWLLKNSWGRSWGDMGYIKIARNRRNLCGVASYAVLPIL